MSQPVGFDLAESILANNVRTTVLGHRGLQWNTNTYIYTHIIRIYFRDMSHLRESLNDLLGPNFIAS